jgi:PleD family two-component response regulator
VTIFEHSFQVTLSAGVTSSASGSKAEDLIMVADRALYRAKELGRDRVETETLPADAARRQRFAPSTIAQPT